MGVRSKRAGAAANQSTTAGGGTQQGASGPGQSAGGFLKGGRGAKGAGPAASNGSGRQKQAKSTTAWLVELVAIVGIAVLLAFGIQDFIVKPYKIPSGSMEPTLKVGQRVLVNRISTNFSEPHIGEIAVFHPPEGTREEQCGATPRSTIDYGGAACDETNPHESSENFIKRVVAGPGDTIYIREGHVYLKTPGHSRFVREHDPYIKPCGGVQECNFPTPITIPAGHWFMMGDNRGDSDDSRFWGPVPRSWIIGGAFLTYWPPDRIGTL
ncbi:MAG TPA: signal peptidase I [Solirubrobacteraceae bacterium]|nr:signal peptidase I [Solirubrobacteraceae bacterium]